MKIVNSNLTPFDLINSPLVGLNDGVTLYYSDALDTFYNANNDPVLNFFKDTTFLTNVSRMLDSSVLSQLSPLVDINKNIDNHKNIKHVRSGAITGFKHVKGFNLNYLKHDTKRCTIDCSIKLETTVEEALKIDKDTIDIFYIIVKTDVALIRAAID